MPSNSLARAARPFALGTAAIIAGLLVASSAAALEPVAARPAPRGLDVITIDAPGAAIPGAGALWVFTNTWIVVPLALSDPAPPGTYAFFESSYVPNLSEVAFGIGDTWSTDALVPQGTPVEFYPGWTGTAGYFRFQSGSVAAGDPSVLYMVQVTPPPAPRGGVDCYFMFWCELMHLALGPQYPDSLGCPPAPPRSGITSLDVLRRYRDEVLASNAHGQFYMDLYNQWSHEAMLALVASPALAVTMWNARAEWLAGFQALVDGQGATFQVTAAMQASLSDILDKLQAAGSPAFASVLTFERSRLHADAVAGLSMTQLENQVETLGGVAPVEPQSWGRTKALYR